MTSFIIKDHVDRTPSSWQKRPDCPFCEIIQNTNQHPAWKVYENDMVLAILDILPLRPGHTLVIPKIHCSRVSDLPEEYGAAVGIAVSKVAKALTQELDNNGLNIVCNQEYAQAVPHVHYHVIPAPTFTSNDAPKTTSKLDQEMHMKEFEAREELDDDEAAALSKVLRARL